MAVMAPEGKASRENRALSLPVCFLVTNRAATSCAISWLEQDKEVVPLPGSKGGWKNEDLAKGDKGARPDLEGLEFTQLLLEVVGSPVWAEVGFWKVERMSPVLGRETSWTVGRTGHPGKWGGGVCRGAMRRAVGLEKLCAMCQTQLECCYGDPQVKGLLPFLPQRLCN